ncbi:MAG: hypothetical protein DBX61_05880 [Clostridiales bacterium]|nr:MAG: hypothetical protein DBX61_05880 [Clostridiales bacterium]
MKRILCFIISIVVLAMISACDDKDVLKQQDPESEQISDNQNGSASSDDNEEIDYTSDLSKEKYDGYNYRILVRKDSLSDQYLENDSDDLVESATFRRNKLIEQMYGITITASESSSNNYDIDALNSILAGDDAYDLVFTHARAAFVYAVQGAAYNFRDIESIHLDKPWWTKDVVESCTLNGKLYVLDGDISSKGLGATMCMVFNKRIFDELGFDYPYKLVKEGDWTFDEFAYTVKKGAKDLNGDGIIEPEFDQLGYSSSQWEAPMNIIYTGGQKIYDKDENGDLQLTLYSNKTVEIYDEFFSLMDNKACYLGTEKSTYNGPDLFNDGRAMIADSELRHAQTLRNLDDDFGIIPYPKFDEDDEYATAVNAGSHMIFIPITVEDVERTGAITEALCAIGSRDVIPAFYEKSLKTKYTRDEESEEMIDIIRDSVVFDLGYVIHGTFSSCGKDLAVSTTHDFASYYAAGETAAKINLEEFYENYGGVSKED